MPHLLLDLYKLLPLHSGLGQFSQALASEIIRQRPEGWEITLLLPRGATWPTTQGVHIRHSNWQLRHTPSLGPSYDLWHSFYQLASHHPPKGVPHVLTVHDLNFLIEKNGPKRLRYHERLRREVQRADELVAISRYTEQQLRHALSLGERPIHVIYNGVPPLADPSPQAPPYVPATPFFFSLGIFSEKKNFHSLLPLMQEFPDHSLIIAGKDDTAYGDAIREQIHALGMAERVVLPGPISEADKTWLYTHCDALLFPSIAEGFGLPVVEAMQLGKPALLSQATSLPEVGGDAAWYVDDFAPVHMAARLREGLAAYAQAPTVYAEQLQAQAAQFSWKRAAAAYWEVYQVVRTAKFG